MDAFFGQLFGSLKAHLHHAAISNDGAVSTFALHVGHTQRNGVLLLGHHALGAVQGLLLQEHDGVVVTDGGFQQALGVIGRGGDDHLQAGEVGQTGLKALGVLGGGAGAGTGGGAHDQRNLYLATEHEAHLGCFVYELVKADAHEVREHQLHDGAHTGHGGTNTGTDISLFRDGGIHDSVFAELFQHAAGDAESATVFGDIFTHHKDVFITLHFLAHGIVDGLRVCDLFHSSHGLHPPFYA